MRAALLAAAAALPLLAGPALALDPPVAGPRDPRMRTVIYRGDDVVQLVLSVGQALMVEFATTEAITDVATSDGENLMVSPSGAHLFFKAKNPLAAQPVFVLTRRADGSTRRYAFQVSTAERVGLSLGGVLPVSAAAAPPADPPFYGVRFSYPADEAAERAARARAAAAERAAQAAPRRLRQPDPGPRNVRYVARGDTALTPAEVWDDGRALYLRFPGNQRMPALFALREDGTEAALAYSTDPDQGLMTIHTTPRRILLRDGDLVLEVRNTAPDPVGRRTGTGTVSSAVLREARPAR